MERVFVAGHKGLVGAAIVRALGERDCEILTVDKADLDLRNRDDVQKWMRKHTPDTAILSAARVGGIAANMADPVGFLLDNLRIQDAVMTEAVEAGVEQTVFFGSSCMYPRETAQPMAESQLMTGALEPTNEAYAVAKIAGVQLAKALHEQRGVTHICPLPCNVYGPGDHFEFERSHVVSALVRRFVDADRNHDREVTIWGTGVARREFIHCDDLASAVLFLLDNKIGPEPINVGSGQDVPIRELAETISTLVGYDGDIVFDHTKPDGMPRKLLDVSRLHDAGWHHRYSLAEGLKSVIWDYQERYPAMSA